MAATAIIIVIIMDTIANVDVIAIAIAVLVSARRDYVRETGLELGEGLHFHIQREVGGRVRRRVSLKVISRRESRLQKRLPNRVRV